MKPKFIQTGDLYKNNEYPNMPSIGRWFGERITTKNKSRIDWALVDEIVKKHGFNYCLIQDTFASYGEWGVYEVEFVLYYKTDIDSDWYRGKVRNMEYDACFDAKKKYLDIPQKLHDCVHELDEQTELEFDTGWAGNCGIFGSHDVSRNTYRGGDYLYDWNSITDKWSPLIHNTDSKLRKGVYLMMTSSLLKKRVSE